MAIILLQSNNQLRVSLPRDDDARRKASDDHVEDCYRIMAELRLLLKA